MHVTRVTHRLLTLLAAVVAPLAFAQQNWRWANMLPASERWKNVAYGNGVYAMIGNDATIVTSPDTANWTVQRMSTMNQNLNGIVFANGRFVAVGGGTATNINAPVILTSTDGVTWTQNETVAAQNFISLSDVVFGNGLFVAAASNQRVFTSTDGLNWTLRDVGQLVQQGAFGGGKFVFTSGSNSVVVSSDGITYTKVAVAPTGGFISAVAFGNNRFVALGRDSSFNPIAYVSTDGGTTWTASATIGTNSPFLLYLGANGSTFVAGGSVSGGTAVLYSSTDGLTWTLRTAATPPARSSTSGSVVQEQIGAVTSANDILFATGIYGGITTSTDNGATWTRRGSGTAHDLNGLVHDGTRFVAVGTGGTVLTSPDGVTWTASASNQTTAWFGQIAFGNGRYVTAGTSGLFQSNNLTTWTNVITNQMTGVIYANNLFVAVGSGVNTLRTSPDGVTWATGTVQTGSGTIASTQGIAGGGGTFVIVAGAGGGPTRIFSSSNATTWNDVTPSALTTVPESLAYTNGRYVMLTTNQSWTSTNGSTWTLTSIPTLGIRHVMAVGNTFVALTQKGSYMNSSDGVTWSDIPNSLGPNALSTAMVAVNSKVVYTSGGGGILIGDLASGPASPDAPKIAASPQAQTISTGGSVVFSVSATSPIGGSLTYQWRLNGVAIAGATSATYVLRGATAANAGSYTCLVTNSAGGTTSSGAALTLSSTSDFGRISNLSVLTSITATEPSFTVGTVVAGSGTKPLLVRAVGPSLSQLGVPGALADPKLDVFVGQTVAASNDNWNGDAALTAAFTAVGAFPFASGTSKDAAVYQANAPVTAYTVQVSGVGGATGSVIAELYDSTPTAAFTASTPRLANVSVLKNIPAGGSITEGFTIGGSTAKTVLIRAIGPGLSAVGVSSGTLADPSLTLFNSSSVAISANDNWGGDAQLTTVGTAVGAFAISGATSKDAMLLVTLPPGGYTAQATGVGGTGGLAIVEVYEVP